MSTSITDRLRRGAAPLDDPDLNDEAATELELRSADAARLDWVLTNVFIVAMRRGISLPATLDRVGIDAAMKTSPNALQPKHELPNAR